MNLKALRFSLLLPFFFTCMYHGLFAQSPIQLDTLCNPDGSMLVIGDVPDVLYNPQIKSYSAIYYCGDRTANSVDPAVSNCGNFLGLMTSGPTHWSDYLEDDTLKVNHIIAADSGWLFFPYIYPFGAINIVNDNFCPVEPADQEDRIVLHAGWNLISLDVKPDNNDIASIFSGLQPGNLQYVTGFKGEATFYDPSGLSFFNTLTHIEPGYGYWVRVVADDVLNITGQPLSESDQPDLKTGWNLIAYAPSSSVRPEVYFDNLIRQNQLDYVTGFDRASVYFNPNGLPFYNSLHQLQNGLGYWVRVNQDVSSAQY